MIRFTIFGQPCSKANSRRLVHIPDGQGGKRASFVKSRDALDYEREALRQIPPVYRRQLEGPVRVTIRIFYETERPDLDESIVLDVLQDRYARSKETGERVLVQKGVIKNDRQVREKHIFHHIDRREPRAEIEVEPIAAPQADLLARQRSIRDEAGAPF